MPVTRPYTATSLGGVTAAASFTVTSPGTIETNDVVFVWVSSRQDRTVTTPTGWTLITGDPLTLGTGTAGINLYTYWRRGNPATWTFDLSASHAGWCWGCDVYRGVRTTGDPWAATTGRVESATVNTVNGTITVEAPGLTGLAGTDYLAVVAGAAADTSVPVMADWGAAPTGYTQIVEVFTGGGGYSLMLAINQLATNNVPESVWTVDTGPQNSAVRTMALVPAVSVVARPRSGWGLVA